MARLIVTDPVFGCDWHTVTLDYVTWTFPTDDAGRAPRLRLRAFFPPDIDGRPFVDAVMDDLQDHLQNSTGTERDCYGWIQTMCAFHILRPKLDHQRRRRFRHESLNFSETFKQVTDLTGSQGQCAGEQLCRIAPSSSAPTVRLIHEAIYVRPDLVLPLAAEHYRAFREQVLAELCWTAKVTHLQVAVAAEQRRHRTSDLPGTRGAGTTVREDDWNDPERQRRWCRAMRHLLKRTVQQDKKLAKRFADLVERAQRLQEPVGSEVAERKIRMLHPDGVRFTAAYAACIARHFDVPAADGLLDAVIERFEKIYHLPPTERDAAARLVLTTPADDGAPTPKLAFERQHYAGLIEARRSTDRFEKWAAVGWISANLVDRTECLRLMEREAEAVFVGVLAHGFEQVYRKIRRRLTRSERRFFQLAYFRRPAFAGRIPALCLVLGSFFTGMDEDTRDLAIQVLVLKPRSGQGHAERERELERRWRAYWRCYPIWLEIIRDEDRQSAAMQRHTLRSLEDPWGTQDDGEPVTLGDTLPARPDDATKGLFSLVFSADGRLTEQAKAYCTSTQAVYLQRIADGETATRIAATAGVSQPAVSKAVHKAVKRIRAGLIRDGDLYN